jgi:hypothetical protein
VNTPEETQALREKLSSKIYDLYEISSSVPEFVEFVSKGITKSGALELIGKKLGISPKEIIAFGDQDNDIPMLKYAGFSVAMANGSKEVKNFADHVTASNDEDGVALAIENIVL